MRSQIKPDAANGIQRAGEGQMWCVLYGKDGDEERMEQFVRGVLPGHSYSRCFHPLQHKMMRHSGEWRDIVFRLLPGYVFIETDDPKRVYQVLKNTPKQLLFSTDDAVSVLAGDDAALLENIMDQDGQIGISTVRVAGEEKDGRKQIEYLSGPLITVADRVTRVNLHRRIARVMTGLAGERKWINLDFCFEDDKVVGAKV